jgi:hypothetical protein
MRIVKYNARYSNIACSYFGTASCSVASFTGVTDTGWKCSGVAKSITGG